MHRKRFASTVFSMPSNLSMIEAESTNHLCPQISLWAQSFNPHLALQSAAATATTQSTSSTPSSNNRSLPAHQLHWPRAHDINANQVFAWRKLYKDGRLDAQHSQDCKLLPVVLAESSLSLPPPTGAREVMASPGGVIHLTLNRDSHDFMAIIDCFDITGSPYCGVN